MNRNHLKIIAVITMLIDHIGAYLITDPTLNTVCRSIGRLAFPIFAFFIAEGMRHTHNRLKYALSLLVCAVVSQIPITLLEGSLCLNVLFGFLIAMLIVYVIEHIKSLKLLYSLILIVLFMSVCFLNYMNQLDYGIIGVLLTLIFYYVKPKQIKFLLAALLLTVMTFTDLMIYGFIMENAREFLAILSLGLLMLYNGQKGKLNLKWSYYIFYPAHLTVIYLLTFIF